jgi:hypothetical protein
VTYLCLVLAICGLAVALYAAYQVHVLANAQAVINQWAEDSLVDHKKALEQHDVGLVNHKDRIMELFDILNLDKAPIVQKRDNYSKETH